MTEFNNYAVGRVVRRIRKSKKLSQEVFSGFAQLARSHLAMIESGSKQANFETVWRIAAAFDMHPSWFGLSIRRPRLCLLNFNN